MAVYDDYIYRLSTVAPQPVFSVDLPKDLQWPDEFTWNKVEQNAEYSIGGNLLTQEGVKLQGRHITLTGIDNMAWITREKAIVLQAMQDSPGLIMTLQFLNSLNNTQILFTKNVMFRLYEKPAVDIKRILQYDQFEAGAWYIVNSIKLMETLAYGA